jgi:hypothetical protein
MIRKLLAAWVLSLVPVPQAATAQGADIPIIADIVLNVGQPAILDSDTGAHGVVQTQLRLPPVAHRDTGGRVRGPVQLTARRWLDGPRAQGSNGRAAHAPVKLRPMPSRPSRHKDGDLQVALAIAGMQSVSWHDQMPWPLLLQQETQGRNGHAMRVSHVGSHGQSCQSHR